MTAYFKKEYLEQAKKQRKKNLIVFFSLLGAYLLVSVGLFIWYTTLPYKSPTISVVKSIHYVVTGVSVIVGALILGITFKRVNRFYKLTYNMYYGIKEKFTGSFIEYDETIIEKDGVEFKSLVFLEWNKYKNDFFERKVYVFSEKPLPQIEVGKNVKYITQSNVLLGYEILP